MKYQGLEVTMLTNTNQVIVQAFVWEDKEKIEKIKLVQAKI